MSKNPSLSLVAFFVTSNIHKFYEARLVLSGYKIATALLRLKTPEIQDDEIENIAKASAVEAAKECNLPIIVEDAGLFIEVLGGFPGPYSKYVYRTLGTKGLLKLMEDVDAREAYFRSVIAFCDPKKQLLSFHGEVKGRISKKERGNLGFGFDPIFESLNNKTFAEMSIEEKNKCSHRAEALRKFAEWYVSNYNPRQIFQR